MEERGVEMGAILEIHSERTDLSRWESRGLNLGKTYAVRRDERGTSRGKRIRGRRVGGGGKDK